MSNEELVTRIQSGEAALMGELYEQVKGLLCSICWRYRFYDDLNDLEQEAVLALYDAVGGFNPARGNSFSTYLVKCVKRHLYRYLSGIPQNISSLDEPFTEDGATLGDLLAGPENPEEDAIQSADAEHLREILWNEVDKLQDAEVIRALYLDGKTLKEVGIETGLSIEGIRTRRQRALKNLKRSRRLRSYLDDEIYSQALKGNGVNRYRQTWTSSTERIALHNI